jgi:3-dehydroquinate synthetase
VSTSTVRVRSKDGGYPVLVGVGLTAQLPRVLEEQAPAPRYAVISDDNVASLHGHPVMEMLRDAGLDASLFTFPAGESSKTRESWSILTDEMLEAGFGRDTCVVAVGGGVTTDLAGFVAATYLRGVAVVQVPTSYLAMIDASVGGKTGVDVSAGKNLVGAFHPPKAVVADTEVLRTLPRGERAQAWSKRSSMARSWTPSTSASSKASWAIWSTPTPRPRPTPCSGPSSSRPPS